MTTDEHPPTLLLIAGYWLGAWAWDEVVEQLEAAGRRAVPLTLPGLDPEDAERATRKLDDQVDAVLEAASSEEHPVLLVAHSGANAPVSMVLDRRPDLVSRVVWVDSGPVADGAVGSLPPEVADLPLPPFEELAASASLEGLRAGQREAFRDRAVPQPGAAIRQPVALRNDARRSVPTTLVCCSISSEQLMDLARAGHPMFAEVALLTDLELVDLPTGHWPMWSRPSDLAQVLIEAS